jgi:hypothetical protein
MYWRTGLIAVLVAACSTKAPAMPAHQESLAKYYDGFLPRSVTQCIACHDVPHGVEDPAALEEMPSHNAFGERLMELGVQLEAEKQPADIVSRLTRLAEGDADGDGLANELELLAGRSPGHTEAELDAVALSSATMKLQQFQSRYQWKPLLTVVRPEIPTTARQEWVRNPIDAFVSAEHLRRGLHPVDEADRHVLLRRVYLDLTGLPPSREQLRTFLVDQSPDAYERVVDRLLASPRYGERWGRHWMDVWRYSDWAGWSDGGQIRDSQPHIWRWRDWIVESLNVDKGYDQMVMEMLAADELAPTDQDALRATGYLVRNYKMLSRETWMQDVVNHTAQAFLGMTLGCARCHDHRYDAITQKEYYQFRAVFEPHQVRIDPLAPELDTKKDGLARAYDADAGAPTYLYIRGDDRQPDTEHPLSPGVPTAWGSSLSLAESSLPPAAYYPGLRAEIRQSLIEQQESLISTHAAALTTLSPDSPEAAQNELRLRAAEAELTSLRARIQADDAKYRLPVGANAAELAKVAAASERRAAAARSEVDLWNLQQAENAARAALKADDPATQKALTDAEAMLAEARQKHDAAVAAVKEVSEHYSPLTAVYPATTTGRRLALARWLVDPSNPLAARVAVNHIWRRHFGQAIVPSMYDFGNNGRAPSNAALLDWLAAELMQPSVRLDFQAGGAHWTSEEHAAPAWSMKHLHRLIVTSAAYRLSARNDAQNAAIDQDNRFVWRMPSHRLEAEVVRDSVLFVAGQLDLTMGGAELDHLQGDVPRRSIYFRHAQEKQMEILKIFDCAAVSECYERKESIVPQQALALMNSGFVVRNARALARKLSRDSHSQDTSVFVQEAFESVLSRPPAADELSACLAFLDEQVPADKATTVAAASPNDATSCDQPAADPQLRARENLVQVLMNHNDFVIVH